MVMKLKNRKSNLQRSTLFIGLTIALMMLLSAVALDHKFSGSGEFINGRLVEDSSLKSRPISPQA